MLKYIILIDTTTRMTPGAAAGGGPSMAKDVACWAVGARVVKAFNTTGYANLRRPRFGELNADMFVCGDDVSAKVVAISLAEGTGFDVVDAGPLSNAALLESLVNCGCSSPFPWAWARTSRSRC